MFYSYTLNYYCHFLLTDVPISFFIFQAVKGKIFLCFTLNVTYLKTEIRSGKFPCKSNSIFVLEPAFTPLILIKRNTLHPQYYDVF